MSSVAVVAAMKRAERRLVARLREAQATSPTSAGPLPSLRWVDSRRLGRLRASGSIREPEPGRFYLDEPAYALYQSHRRKVGLALVAGLVILGLAAGCLIWRA